MPLGDGFCPRINDWGNILENDSDLFMKPRYPMGTNSARVSSSFIIWVYGCIFSDCCSEGGGSIKERSLALDPQLRDFYTGCALPDAKESSNIPPIQTRTKETLIKVSAPRAACFSLPRLLMSNSRMRDIEMVQAAHALELQLLLT